MSARFDTQDLQLHATFHPGTLRPADLAFVVFFDLDQNPSTGSVAAGTVAVGSDVRLTFNAIANSSLARIRGDSVPVTFGADSFSISMPLTVLGDDGHANFGILVGDPTSDQTFEGRDFAPSIDFQAPLTTATQFVPEPTSRAVIVLGLLCLIMGLGRVGDQ
jgi:hypothetical protein